MRNTNYVEVMETISNTNIKEETIMRRLTNKVVGFAGKGYKKVNEALIAARDEEMGASELVIIIGLIVVALVLVAVFRTQLTNIINTVGNKVINWINAN